MRYRRSFQYRHANIDKVKHFMGMKSAPYEGRSFNIDEHDLRMIAANLRKREYPLFEKEFKEHPYSAFRMLQDFEYKRKKVRR